eukprot:10713441-Alexandrium_andersonii.AAC.1
MPQGGAPRPPPLAGHPALGRPTRPSPRGAPSTSALFRREGTFCRRRLRTGATAARRGDRE